jgi:mannobiose 2-epimerase
MNPLLQQYRNEMAGELGNILDFWQHRAVDEENGGFYGKVDNKNRVFANAPKGAVLNSRILWTFSAAYNLTRDAAYLRLAERAYSYIKDYFLDLEYGGVYWTVDQNGKPLDTKKQIYALAFALYGMSEYYLSSGREESRTLAIELYHTIMKYSYDRENGGYLEALGRKWETRDDLRLSEKDSNEKKSMNTHLHLLEGFSALYRIWPDEALKERIGELIFIFLNHMVDPETHHLILFFDEKWTRKSAVISYGHDIEAAWLIQEAAEVIGNSSLLETVRKEALLMADSAAGGLDADGGLWYEYEPGRLIREKHSWPQAEAMVGFFNAWEISHDQKYLNQSLRAWQFIRDHILDRENGEWFWGVKEDYSIMDEDKVGIWKCPYHNARACMELMRRIRALEKKLEMFSDN